MSGPAFHQFFQTAFGKADDPDFKPFRYQCRLACGAEADLQNPATLVRGAGSRLQLINIPTGLGKTAAMIGARRLAAEPLSTECRKMGRCQQGYEQGHESWTKCILRLPTEYGPFKLAYCDMWVRAADDRSKSHGKPT